MTTRRTDYSKIAGRYDLNPIRRRIPCEPAIGEVLAGTVVPLVLLDLACGTGNFLWAQYQEYGRREIVWHGCDLSIDMLRVAGARAPFAAMEQCDAQALPYQDGLFGMVTCNYAFHHFLDKPGSLDEVRRTLEADGVFVMRNIWPEGMSRWWVYRYFPTTRAIDQERFWSNGRLQAELGKRGFRVEVETTAARDACLGELIVQAENRDMSQLALVDESEYRDGVDRMKRDLARGDDLGSEVALLRLVGRKGGGGRP